MIPRRLHYCWLSGDPFPESISQCMDTWHQHLPGWEWILWDMNRFDVDSVPYVKRACKHKKWAFAADYIRLHALNEMGGLYLDSDVSLHGDVGSFLNHQCMIPIEYHADIVQHSNTQASLDEFGSRLPGVVGVPGIGLQAAIMASVPRHPFIQECLSWYKGRNFEVQKGEVQQSEIAPTIYAHIAEGHGFAYKNEDQHLQNDFYVPSNRYFAGTKGAKSSDSLAVHNCAGSWRVPSPSLLHKGMVKLGKLMGV